MNQEVNSNEIMNILKQLLSSINLNVPISSINKEFQYIIEGAYELVDIYYNKSNSIHQHYNVLDNKIIIKNSTTLLKEIIKHIEEIKNTLPENVFKLLLNTNKLPNIHYASNS